MFLQVREHVELGRDPGAVAAQSGVTGQTNTVSDVFVFCAFEFKLM